MEDFINEFLTVFGYDHPISAEFRELIRRDLNDNLELLQELNKLVSEFKRLEKVFSLDSPKEGYELKKLQTKAFEYLDKWRMVLLHKSFTKNLSFYS